MAKRRVAAIVKIQIQAGAATPAPPVGTALGPHGINIMDFCKAYNAATESQRGNVIPVEITVYEDRSRPNYLMEVFRFKDESEFTAFDDKFHKDRKIAAIYALLDDIVEAEKSDFKIFERRL